MPTARTTRTADLEPLLDLFRASEVSSVVGTIEQAHAIWRQTLDRDGVTVFVSESDGKIVATCMLITAPNLLRQRAWACIPRERRHSSSIPRTRAWSGCGRGRAFSRLGGRLLSRHAAKRQEGSSSTPLLRALQFRARIARCLCRSPRARVPMTAPGTGAPDPSEAVKLIANGIGAFYPCLFNLVCCWQAQWMTIVGSTVTVTP